MCEAEAEVIDAGHFLQRIGTDEERPNDRRFAAALATMCLTHAYREARAAGDYEALAHLDREWAMVNAL